MLKKHTQLLLIMTIPVQIDLIGDDGDDGHLHRSDPGRLNHDLVS